MYTKVLHAAYQKNFSPGISAQMYAEQKAADEIGINWHSRLYTSRSTFPTDVVDSSLGAGGASKKNFYRWLTKMSEQYDAILLRHMPADCHELKFLLRAKLPVFLMHHTLEVPELLVSPNARSVAKAAAEVILAPWSIRQARGIVGVTEEIVDYELLRSGCSRSNSIVYPNGVDLSSIGNAGDARTGSVPRLIFVSSYFQPWQGLDRLISAAKSCDEEFVIDIVGNVNEADANSALLDRRFILHGHLDNSRVDALLAKSWLALSCFALDRKKMKQACTLKVRQYLSHGVAVYASHLDVFPPKFPYFKTGDCNLNDIVSFARNMRQLSREDIRKITLPYIDKVTLLRGCYERLMRLA